ncbi:MAG: STAS domain-containing protein [Solirubrobacteraceae bacterium]|jgi:anti-sigma B factor antagonist
MGFFYIGDESAVEEPSHGDDVAVMVAGGELDFAASPQLKDRLTERIDAGSRRLILDLSGATFVDSTAIGALVSVATLLNELGGGMLLIVCPDENRRLLRIFEIAGIESLIAVHRSRAEALRELAVAD